MRLRIMRRFTPNVHSDLEAQVMLHHELYLWIVLWLNI